MKWFLYLSLPLFLLDVLTKWWTVTRFPNGETLPGEEITVVPDVFWLERVHNNGVAFGMGNGGKHSNLIFGAISTAAMLFVAFAMKKGAFPTRLSQIAAALLMSGIWGNLLDRLTRGYVVDFLRVDLKFMMWPSFNLADSWICIAAVLLFITAFQKDPTQVAPERG
jgi:signal peptidase II